MTSPIKKFSAGGIAVAVWENESKDGKTFNSVTMDRRYKDKNEAWQSTGSLRATDIPKAIVTLQKAYEYLILKEPSAQNISDAE